MNHPLLIGSPSPCHRQRGGTAGRANSRDSSSDSEWSVQKDSKQHRRSQSHTSFSTGKAILFAAICSSIAAVLMAFIALWFFYSSSLLDLHADQLITTTSVVRTRFRPTFASPSYKLDKSNDSKHQSQLRSPLLPPRIRSAPEQHREEAYYDGLNVTLQFHDAQEPLFDDGVHPHVAWLMSFPNSGTSFTIHMTREATNCTTATNYALEGEIRDKPSVPAIHSSGVDDDVGSQGPWLELIPNRHTNVPKHFILTKTHCKGFCTGKHCGPEKTILTVRSFMMGCLSGTRAIKTPRGGLEKIDVTYSPSLVKKAIHIFRHPLDNIVARFHLEYNVNRARGNHRYKKKFPKNSTGFRRWCEAEDQNQELLHSPLLDRHLRRQLSKIPCFADFFRYVQWHNLAFSTSHHMNLPTLILHYHEYSTDFENARGRILKFLDLPRTGEGIDFHSGKVYRNYYTTSQKKAIRAFLQEFSSAETWEQLKGYDFETGDQMIDLTNSIE